MRERALGPALLGTERIGSSDNFFDLGGHSLLAVRLTTKLKERFGREVPLAALFQAGTVLPFLASTGQAAGAGASGVEGPQALAAYLRDSDGLILVKEYYTSTDVPNGAVAGRLRWRWLARWQAGRWEASRAWCACVVQARHVHWQGWFGQWPAAAANRRTPPDQSVERGWRDRGARKGSSLAAPTRCWMSTALQCLPGHRCTSPGLRLAGRSAKTRALQR